MIIKGEMRGKGKEKMRKRCEGKRERGERGKT